MIVLAHFPPDAGSADEARVTLQRDGHCFIITMQDRDNRFSMLMMTCLNQALSQIEAIATAEDMDKGAVVTTSANEKIWSNGLEIAEVTSPTYFRMYHQLLTRMLTFCLPTVAALTGHTFAGGLMFAFAHDVRVLRSDRGLLCMPEVDLGMPLTPGMAAIVRAKVSDAQTLRALLIVGQRFDAAAALRGGLVDAAVPTRADVLPEAQRHAALLAPKAAHREVLLQLKRELYAGAVSTLESNDLGFYAKL
ncbi:hypothetical protein CXG81DRAFT_9069 [Caulochytrium protostelioides]|uniref:ClpP/crotonase n=1 Tax=Caulochytrium protostelioides TaxID=1555241 RepID=A0A4V1IVE1_9FUNG|nr:hypothetical protein CXG81DRAFT_9069 [Caulochytrium protostelioides]|eukprot:RKP03739.1 hypothetical protein CXG81DRAFT_9069 [Caulochytrium protostelioides]